MESFDKVAADSLNRYDMIKSVRSKIQKSVPKPVLCTPYKIEWPHVDQRTQENVISHLQKFFKENNVCLESICKASLKNLKKAEKKARLRDHAFKNKSSEVSKLRSQLAFGIQEVTRNLENKNLSLIIVDRTSPWQLHRHLIQLSALRECPAIAVNQLSETISPLLSISRLCVFAIKNIKEGNSGIFHSLIESIAPLCPKYEIPWLEAENQLLEIKKKQISGISACDDTCQPEYKICEEIQVAEDKNTFENDFIDLKNDSNSIDSMEHDNPQHKETDGIELVYGSDIYTGLYIKAWNNSGSRIACEVIDVEINDLWNYNIGCLKKNVLKRGDKLSMFTNPTERTLVKRFQPAEVRKIHKNEFKKRKLN